MRDIKDLCARIEDELSKIADNGLTTGNLEMTYKLIDMYKDIKNTPCGGNVCSCLWKTSVFDARRVESSGRRRGTAL